MNLYERVLPSGRCVRMREFETADRLAIGTRLSRRCAPDLPSQDEQLRESVLTILVAYTPPQPFVYLPSVDKDGKPVLDAAGAPVLSKNVDADAMLDALKPEMWLTATYQALVTEGPGQLEKIFKSVRDWKYLVDLANEASGFSEGPTDPGKARVTTG